jgi:hypothetical protein
MKIPGQLSAEINILSAAIDGIFLTTVGTIRGL